MQGCHTAYAPPSVSDYGDLRGVTGAVHMLLGTSAAQELTFSSPTHSLTGAEGATATSGGPGSGTSAAGGGGSAHGGGSTGGGGGNSLPFTGLEVGIVAAVGSALAAAGAALRRLARRES